MKKAISLLTAVLLVFCMALPVMASDPSEETVLTFEDGSYLVVTLDTTPLTRTISPVAAKTYTYYNVDDERQWDYTLMAQFSYNGSTSSAIEAKSKTVIYNREWSQTYVDVYREGAYAYGEAVFEHSSDGTVPITVTIYCDKNGNIS